MSFLCCETKRNCTGIAIIFSVIIAIVAAFLQITATITIAPVALLVAFGIAIAYLAIILVATVLARNADFCRSICTVLSTLLFSILGVILFTIILLAIPFAATSIIGAIIVGTGLPKVCTERELLKQYFDTKGLGGFDYAYLYPGMNKVLQSAGRVIRTVTDKGCVLLLDERFARSEYQRLFPREWKQPVFGNRFDLRKVLESFWEE